MERRGGQAVCEWSEQQCECGERRRERGAGNVHLESACGDRVGGEGLWCFVCCDGRRVATKVQDL